MVQGLLRFELIGTVARETRHSVIANGTHRCSIDVKVDEPTKIDGEWVQKTKWVTLVWFGPDSVKRQYHKGTVLWVAGDVEQYEEKVNDRKIRMHTFMPKTVRIISIGLVPVDTSSPTV